MNNENLISNILTFWFSEPMKDHWFSSTLAIDNEILVKYQSIWKEASEGRLDQLKENAKGCLALCIILDQFPLNMFRGTAKSFSTEQQAIAISKYAVENKHDLELPDEQVSFLYMPLMHSENMDDQNLSVLSFGKRGLNSHFSTHHREIIKQFGRFPHRNDILDRKSTKEELAYLASDEAFNG